MKILEVTGGPDLSSVPDEAVLAYLSTHLTHAIKLAYRKVSKSYADDFKTEKAQAWLVSHFGPRIREAKATLAGLVSQGRISVYRAVIVPQPWREHLDAQNVGVYWSWDRRSAKPYCGDGQDGVGIVLAAEVPVDAVDWVATIGQNITPEFAKEREIRIHRGTELPLVAVYRGGKAQKVPGVTVRC